MALKGPDISSYQSGLDLNAIDYDFVIIKATEGTDYVNGSCDRHYQQAKSAGKLRAVYHFARNDRNSAEAEAQFFFDNVKGYIADGDAFFVLDWEKNVADVAWAAAFIQKFKDLSGKLALIYMSESVVNSYDWSAVINMNVGLWVAKYRDNVADFNYDMSNAGAAPSIKGWKFYCAWQWTSTGRLNGYDGNLDLNEFYGDRSAWLAYAGGSAPAPATPNVPAQAPAAPAAQVKTYTVNKGEYLSLIAGKVGMSWTRLAAINGISGPNYTIFPGQVLRLEDGAAAPAPSVTYTVKSGDNLSGIAGAYGTTWQDLQAKNGLANPNVIFPGQVLRIR